MEVLSQGNSFYILSHSEGETFVYCWTFDKDKRMLQVEKVVMGGGDSVEIVAINGREIWYRGEREDKRKIFLEEININ